MLADTGRTRSSAAPACGYGANVEKARTGRAGPAPWKDETERRSSEVETPGKGGIDDVVELPRDHGVADDQVPRLRRPRRASSSRLAPRRPRGERGRAQEHARRSSTWRSPPRRRSRRRPALRSATSGRTSSPRQAVRDRRRRVGPRRRERRHRGAGGATGTSPASSCGRDAKVEEWGSFAQASRAAIPARAAGSRSTIARGIEVGHIFKLGHEVLDGA